MATTLRADAEAQDASASSLLAPQAEYTQRLARQQSEAEALKRRERAIGNWRLAVFIVGVVVSWLAFGNGLLSWWWLAIPGACFLALAKQHERVIDSRKRAERIAAYYAQGLRRIEDRWQGNGIAGARFLDPNHPYSPDLDIFGLGSLFELLCTARTQAGETRLASWLSAPATPDTVRARQAAVAELAPNLDLREDLVALGEQVRAALKPESLAAWGDAPALFTSRHERLIATAFAAIALALLAGTAFGLNFTPFLIAVAVNAVFLRTLSARVKQVVHSVDKLSGDLDLFAALLARLERVPVQAPLLQELHAALTAQGVAASARVARLQRLIELLEIPHSQLLRPLNVIVLWSTQCAFVIDAWRTADGAHVAGWLHAVAEWEALSALGCYAYEHPNDVFPEIVAGEPCFVAVGMAHPLLPAINAVRNDISIERNQRLFLVSGSNMSGKSTLLRTIGVNVVLALAGAPVRARELHLTALQAGASIRTQDSLQAGISRFYAEILRLRQIIDMASGTPPLLFLLDEILHGTNSHDRRIGAEAVIRALAANDAIGLITTHDLALAAIAEDPALHAVNVHFEDQLLDGKMTFDYHLRPGIVTKSNAIELMRAVGLEV